MKFIVFIEGYDVYHGYISKVTKSSIFCAVESLFSTTCGMTGVKTCILTEVQTSKYLCSRRIPIKIVPCLWYKTFEKHSKMVGFISIFNELCKKQSKKREPLEDALGTLKRAQSAEREALIKLP